MKSITIDAFDVTGNNFRLKQVPLAQKKFIIMLSMRQCGNCTDSLESLQAFDKVPIFKADIQGPEGEKALVQKIFSILDAGGHKTKAFPTFVLFHPSGQLNFKLGKVSSVNGLDELIASLD